MRYINNRRIILFFNSAMPTIELMLEKFTKELSNKIQLISTRYFEAIDSTKLKQLLIRRPVLDMSVLGSTVLLVWSISYDDQYSKELQQFLIESMKDSSSYLLASSEEAAYMSNIVYTKWVDYTE